MDRSISNPLRALAVLSALVMPCAFAGTSPPGGTPDCDWNAGPLYDVVTWGLYLYGIAPLDSIWEESFPQLLQDREHNYRCLQWLFERGPRAIPGLEAEYARRASQVTWHPTLTPTGVGVAPLLVFLEPVQGREYLIGRIGDARWSTTDVTTIAESIWPRRSETVRRVLRSRLAAPPKRGQSAYSALLLLVQFGRREDHEFIRRRVGWAAGAGPGFARRVELSLLSKDGNIDEVARVLASTSSREYATAAGALLQWGHVDVVCEHLKHESNPERANGIAGEYTSFRRGDYFDQLPDEIIAVIRRAPQAWQCLPPGVKPNLFNAPRDTTKDRAAHWSRPPLGGRPSD